MADDMTMEPVSVNDGSPLYFQPEQEPPERELGEWKVLIVDDEPDVHAATRMALNGLELRGARVVVLAANSAASARAVLQDNPDIALALVDVVMEYETAGLDWVRWVRQTHGNSLIRIVMRTGQAGQLPEETVVREYEIDDFREKTELTAHKLRTLVLSKLRAYDDLRRLQAQSRAFELAVQERTLALASAQEHLVQSEKLASIGLLAAGVAHEINNPIGYIFSNFGTLEKYLDDLISMLELYQQTESALGDAQLRQKVQRHKTEVELEFLLKDIPVLMRESREGIVRVRKIVQDLKDFSRVDATQEWQLADLNQGIESTLNIVNNEVKYKADVVRELQPLPEVQCMASQINQVVMNLVVNAAHAIGTQRGTIVVRSAQRGSEVVLEVQDNGTGIPKDVLPRIFDPFFTTKPVGKGTGLGLSLSYGIVQKHHGHIEVESEVGRGTTFRVILPIQQPASTVPAEVSP